MQSTLTVGRPLTVGSLLDVDGGSRLDLLVARLLLLLLVVVVLLLVVIALAPVVIVALWAALVVVVVVADASVAAGAAVGVPLGSHALGARATSTLTTALLPPLQLRRAG